MEKPEITELNSDYSSDIGNQKTLAFINSVAIEVVESLNDEEKEYIRNNPDPYLYHFSLGLSIRNQYIHNKDLSEKLDHPFFMADDLSGEIVQRVIAILLES